MKDPNLGEELILDTGYCIYLQGNLLMITNHLRLLLIQLFSEASEHLEKLTFGGELRLELVGPHLGRGGSRKMLFADVFDVNVWEGRRVDDPSVPSGH